MANKVLFIGHYRECSGWGYAAINHILALDRAGVDVVARCVKLGMQPPTIPQRLLELENKSAEGCNVCIQFLLPHLMQYDGNFDKNIAMYTTETDSFEYSGWVEKLNCMDEAWVSSFQMVDAAQKSGVKIPLNIVHYPCDVAKFEQNVEPLDISAIRGDFVFYFIGDLTRRKNLITLIKAYHLEFEPSEPVTLLIRGSKHGVSVQENTDELIKACNSIREQLKLYGNITDYKPEVIIGQHLSETDLAKLHVSCDCFVQPSYGEAWGLSVFDALGYGNPAIVTDIGGPAEFVNDNNGWLVKGIDEPVFGMKDTFPQLFTGRENWFSADIQHLRHCMREAYEDKELFAGKSKRATASVYDYSYEKIGKDMANLL